MILQPNTQKFKKSFDIKPSSSHFLQVSQGTKHPYKLTLVEGEAEILGAQIMPNRPLTLYVGEGITIYSWTGCTIQCQSQSQLPNQIGIGLSGLHEGHSDNPMQAFINYHFDLTEARKSALDNNNLGPRILILGDQTYYKKQIWTLFINYTTKMNMKPIFIDLDSDNNIFCNGFIGAVQIDGKYPRDFFNYKNKIVYFSNYDKSLKKPYFLQIQKIAQSIMSKLNKQLENHKEGQTDCQYPAFCSGFMVNLPSLSATSYWIQQLKQTIKHFDITHCIVLEDKKTLAHLLKQYPSIQRMSVPKLDSMKPSFESSQSKVDVYFNGNSKLNNSQIVQKFICEININDVTLYELKISADETPYCIKLDLKVMDIVKAVITVFHAKNDTTDEYVLGNKVLTSPVCCLMRIHGIHDGIITIHSIEENFMKLHKNSLWLYGKVA